MEVDHNPKTSIGVECFQSLGQGLFPRTLAKGNATTREPKNQLTKSTYLINKVQLCLINKVTSIPFVEQLVKVARFLAAMASALANCTVLS